VKQQAQKYFPFYLLSLSLFLPIWLQLLGLTFYRNRFIVVSLGFYYIGIMFISLAATLKHFKPKFKISNKLLLFVGLCIQTLCLFVLYASASSTLVLDVLIFVFVSLLISAWWLMMYFVDLADLDIEKARLIGKKITRYFILCAVLLYVPSMLLGRYFKHQAATILATGSSKVMGALDYLQAEKMLDNIMWQATGLELFLTIFILCLFFYFYKRERNAIENQQSSAR
jgi:hypothetical protein